MANTVATERRASLLAASSHGGAYGVKTLVSTEETTAVTADGDTITFGYIPSNARLKGSSQLYWDDLATSGSPTLDLGLKAVNGNLANADDPDALSNGHDVTAAASNQNAITLPADFGLPAWDFVASETSDPGGMLEVYGTIVDAATTQTGTITLELEYYLD